MGRSGLKIGILTSSRADYGIYQPFLYKLQNDTFFNIEIIAFGSHLSKFHGYTVNQIKADGFAKIHCLNTQLVNDNEETIASSYGLTVLNFAQFWGQNKFDLVVCLGDRYEMSAAVQASIPFGVNIAHIHGGETTLGAIDNIFRHQITLAANIHFTSTETYAKKVAQLIGSSDNILNVGSLSLDGIESFTAMGEKTFREKYDIPEGKYILITFHPETISPEDNLLYANEMKNALTSLASDINLVITLPNADTLGSVYRESINQIKAKFPDRIVLVENFGKQNYFAAMKYCALMVGNTSSGIIEGASFNKYCINVGNRQKGRAQSGNVINCKFNSTEISKKVYQVLSYDQYDGANIYYKKGASEKIMDMIKKTYEKL